MSAMTGAARAKVWPGARVAVLSPTPTHPQDFGNRKRVHAICKRYTDEGALVTFVHYPAELEWRGQLPWRAEREMSQAWAQHFTVGPTRTLHTDPRGYNHSIDEWWDHSIGDFLHWLFSVQTFDIFIVNYSWLSKALEYAPKSTFKILDTHDKFSGRRGMLEQLGLNPEFFYTSESEERVALGRADLVWAIKQEEAQQLAQMTETPVLAMPHLDPLRPLARPAPDPDGYFRVGVIGARNNVNRMNINAFLQVAEPVFRNGFAPIKVVIAGTVCSLIENVGSPFVELRGRVDDVEDFYASVDCVAVPMRVSTGLKIKTGEAISLGVPVVSLAHAFEGYEPAHELHTLRDFPDMARALTELSFAPRETLDALASASRAAHRKTSTAIQEAFRRSDVFARDKRQLIVIAVDSRAFLEGSIFNLALASMREYLSSLCMLMVVVVRGKASEVAANPAAVDRFGRVVVASDLDDAEALRPLLAEHGVEVVAVDEFLKRAQPALVVADALHPALRTESTPDAVLISRVEMMAFSEGRPYFEVPAGGYARAYAATPALSAETASRIAASGAEHLPAPCFWRSHHIRFPRMRDMSGTRSVALLGRPGAPAVQMAAAMARAWKLNPFAVCGLGEEPPPDQALPWFSADDYIAQLLAARTPLPSFAVDLSTGQPGLPLCRELLERLRVPTIATAPIALHRSFAAEPNLLRAATEGELWTSLRFLAQESDEVIDHALGIVWSDQNSDRGWAWIWRYCTNLFETRDAQFT
ncbi:MAG: glycosyltransferase [Alphaproteobacteria bacterium]|nr:glycosyltransferase [Alphaproteobacteria bacterium]